MPIKVPYFKQDTPYSCGPAALQMILRFFDINESEQRLIKKLGTNKKNGTNNHSIIKALNKYGLYCYVNKNSNFEDINHFLKMKLPVLINFIEPSQNVGHYAVVTDIDKKHIVLNDPWNGKNFRLPLREFSKRWVDSRGIHQNWLLVVSKSKFNLGKQFVPKNRSVFKD